MSAEASRRPPARETSRASRSRPQPGLAAAWRAGLELLRCHAIMLAALLPLFFLLLVVVRFAVGVPFLDHWELVPVLEKSYAGTLSFADVWAQHNEHRILFPRLIMLALARVSDWNTHLELEVNIVLGLGILVVYALQVKSTARELRHPDLTWAIPLASLVVFSVTQYENWLWGWELQFFLNLFCVVAGVLVLANGGLQLAALCRLRCLRGRSHLCLRQRPALLAHRAPGADRGDQGRTAATGCGGRLAAGRRAGARRQLPWLPQARPPPAAWLVFKMPAEYATYVLKVPGRHRRARCFRRPPPTVRRRPPWAGRRRGLRLGALATAAHDHHRFPDPAAVPGHEPVLLGQRPRHWRRPTRHGQRPGPVLAVLHHGHAVLGESAGLSHAAGTRHRLALAAATPRPRPRAAGPHSSLAACSGASWQCWRSPRAPRWLAPASILGTPGPRPRAASRPSAPPRQRE